MVARPQFDDSTLWTVEPDVNVFDEHEREYVPKNADGTPILDERGKPKKSKIRFNKVDLEEIAERCNKRDSINQPCPLMIGHTDDDLPETQQPEIVGYARHFKVVWSEKLQRHVIRCSYYLRKDREAEARKYPRTSVEYLPRWGFFDPISLIKRAPMRDLGQWTYQSRGLVLRYAMEDMDDDKGPDKPEKKPNDPNDMMDDGPEGVPPEFYAHFKACMAHEGGAMKNGPDPNAPPPAFPGSPVMPPPGGGLPPPPMPDERQRMSRDSEAIRYSQLKDQVDRQHQELAALRYERDAARCEQSLIQLEAQGVVLNRSKEVARMVKMSEQERTEHLDYIKEHHKRMPRSAREDFIHTAGGNPVMVRNGDNVAVAGGVEVGGDPGDVVTPDDLRVAERYMRDHARELGKLGADEAWETAKKYAIDNRGKLRG